MAKIIEGDYSVDYELCTAIEDDAAEVISAFKNDLRFDKLAKLSEDSARSLAKHQGLMMRMKKLGKLPRFDGLKNI